MIIDTAPAQQRGGKVVDIMEALKRSMERVPARKSRRDNYRSEEKHYLLEFKSKISASCRRVIYLYALFSANAPITTPTQRSSQDDGSGTASIIGRRASSERQEPVEVQIK